MALALALTIGTLTTVAVVLAAVAYVRMPTRARCPECGSGTQAVLPRRGLRGLNRWITFRWCPVCSWEGIGRVGPERVPGRRAAHASGFHWSESDLGQDLGFRWRSAEPSPDPSPEPSVQPTAEPPHHPSGFRFAPPDPAEPAKGPAHPSGFTWADRRPRREAEEAPHGRPSDRPRSRWREEREGHGFRWKDGRGAQPDDSSA